MLELEHKYEEKLNRNKKNCAMRATKIPRELRLRLQYLINCECAILKNVKNKISNRTSEY